MYFVAVLWHFRFMPFICIISFAMHTYYACGVRVLCQVLARFYVLYQITIWRVINSAWLRFPIYSLSLFAVFCFVYLGRCHSVCMQSSAKNGYMKFYFMRSHIHGDNIILLLRKNRINHISPINSAMNTLNRKSWE